MDLKTFYKRLRHYEDINPKSTDDDPYGDNRHTYCHLLYLDPVTKKAHRFEVRGFKYKPEYPVLEISVVNWTMIAGTGGLVLKEVPEELSKWIIEEDSDTSKVLYGYK